MLYKPLVDEKKINEVDDRQCIKLMIQRIHEVDDRIHEVDDTEYMKLMIQNT